METVMDDDSHLSSSKSDSSDCSSSTIQTEISQQRSPKDGPWWSCDITSTTAVTCGFGGTTIWWIVAKFEYSCSLQGEL